MKQHNVLFFLFLVFIVLVFSGCRKRCTEERECFCSDGTSSVQDCYTDGNSCSDCDCVNEYSIWCDDETGLCWQDPQKDAYKKDENGEYIDIGITSKEAVQYCEELVLGGYDDWRIPTIYELRSILDGNPDTEAGGACPVDDNCTFTDSWATSCIGSTMFEGPGVDGCYMKSELTGTCDKPDIYSAGHYLEVWAQESASDDERWLSSVMPEIGGVCFNHICSLGDVRCVRDVPSEPIECAEVGLCTPGKARDCDCSGYDKPDGAQVCNDDGTCWGPCECTGFEADPGITPECSNNVCPDSDKLNLTLTLPEGATLTSPHMLIAFFYDADNWVFPPSRPPDGGTNYNQIIDPGYPPYEMTIPACTYYGEYFLEGNYKLYIHLQANEKFPPIPVAVDYYWGEDQSGFTSSSGYSFEATQTSFNFPITGGAHDSAEVDLEIVLEPVAGCPDEMPIECTSGDCVADASECGTCGDLQLIPDDSGVLTCRYVSTFVDDNCADFPIDQGWTADMVEEFCKDPMHFSDPATLVVTQGNSCLIERGMSSGSGNLRCIANDNGKEWFAYGAMPPVACEYLGGNLDEPGPFCEAY